MGQNGTFEPSSCEIARASAVFPVPGAPTSRSARPENLRDLTRSTTTPQAYRRRETVRFTERLVHVPVIASSPQKMRTSRAAVCPMNPALSPAAYPSALRPRPLMCEWGAIRDERLADEEGGGGTALCATGAEDEAPADGLITLDIVAGSDHVESTGRNDVDATRSDLDTRVGYLVLRSMPPTVRSILPRKFQLRTKARRVGGSERRVDIGLDFVSHTMSSSSKPFVQPGEPLNDFLRSFWQRQIDAAEEETPDYRHPPLPLARIKKVMKSDPEVKVRKQCQSLRTTATSIRPCR